MTIRGLASAHSDQPGCLFVTEQPAPIAEALWRPVCENRFHTAGVKSLADVAHGLLCDAQLVGNMRIIPPFIAFQ